MASAPHFNRLLGFSYYRFSSPSTHGSVMVAPTDPSGVHAVVLNVDDDDVGRPTMTRLLQNAGFDVLEAATGAEALAQAQNGPDQVLLDVHLSDLDGFEVCRRLRQDPATRTIPVLFLSGDFVSSEDRIRGLVGGGDGYLTKPADPREVVAYIQALLRLRQSELRASRLAAIVESSSDAIIGTSLDGAIASWNPGAERLLGFTAGDMLGQPISRLLPAERSRELPEILEGLRGGKAISQRETEWLRQDGKQVQVSISMSPIQEPGGKLVGVSIIARDVSQVKRLEEQLHQAQKMEAIGQLAGGVAHDFNNLLTVIMGHAEFLLGELPAEVQARSSAEEIRKAAERAASLTRQLLAFSRKQVLAPRVLDLNTLVTNLESLLRRMIGEDIDLATRLRPSLGHIRADPNQIEQVLMNLAVNARDAMPHGGRITIETENIDLSEVYAELPPGPYVRLAFSDTGRGMAPDIKQRIFEPFFTTKEPGKGTGLGLATVYGIVKQSGGHISVYSELGVGTTFKIFLPRVEEAVSPTPVTAPPPARGSETILLVEDEPAVRNLNRHVLEEHGYKVLVASNGAEAIQVAQRHGGPIDLLLTDVVMPELGGRPLAELLLTFQPKMKVLYVSGYTNDAIVRHGVLDAETNFLQKPFSPIALARKVREVLE